MNASNLSFLEVIIVGLITGPGGWGLYQHVLTRKKRREDDVKQKDADKQQAEKERKAQLEAERRENRLLAEAQEVAQRTALDSNAKTIRGLEDDCKRCREGLSSLSDATSSLVYLFDAFLARLRPNNGGDTYSATMNLHELGEARRAVNEARRNLR